MAQLLYPQERSGTHCVGGWSSPREGLDGAEILAPLRFDPQTFQPTDSHYTDYTTVADVIMDKM
jgi:hypothetical protein